MVKLPVDEGFRLVDVEAGNTQTIDTTVDKEMRSGMSVPHRQGTLCITADRRCHWRPAVAFSGFCWLDGLRSGESSLAKRQPVLQWRASGRKR